MFLKHKNTIFHVWNSETSPGDESKHHKLLKHVQSFVAPNKFMNLLQACLWPRAFGVLEQTVYILYISLDSEEPNMLPWWCLKRDFAENLPE